MVERVSKVVWAVARSQAQATLLYLPRSMTRRLPLLCHSLLTQPFALTAGLPAVQSGDLRSSQVSPPQGLSHGQETMRQPTLQTLPAAAVRYGAKHRATVPNWEGVGTVGPQQ
jgi:hypothetical protein